MLTIKTQEHPLKPEIGEFEFGASIIHSYVTPDELPVFRMFPLVIMGHYNPFVTLRRMEIHDQDKLSQTQYSCPFNTVNKYYGIVPFGISTKDPKQYRQKGFADSGYDYVFDLEWQARYIVEYLKSDKIISSFLGSGYALIVNQYLR